MGLTPPIEYRLKKPCQPGPQSLWVINRPDLGFVGTGYIFEVLSENVKRWRTSNGIPIGLNFERDLVQALCAQHPDLCTTDDPRAPVMVKFIGLRELALGTQVMVSFVKSGREVVEEEEAHRRARICVSCRFNVKYGKGCGGKLCGSLLKIVKEIVPHGTPYDGELNACGLCGCLLLASIWIPEEIQWRPMTEHLKAKFLANAPKNCWKCASAREKVANMGGFYQ